MLQTVSTGFNLDGYINNGFGVPPTSIAPDRQVAVFVGGLRDLVNAALIYSIATGLIKISFALTLLRVVQDRAHMLILRITIAVATIVMLYFFLFTACSCSPVSYAWNSFRDPYWVMVLQGKNPGTLKPLGHCLPLGYTVRSNYAISAFLIAIDVVLALVMPVLLLRQLHLKLSLKIGTGLLLAFGALASIATILRIPYIHLLATKDALYSASALLFWTDMELSWSIIATSFACLKPLGVKVGIIKDDASKSFRFPAESHGSKNSKGFTIACDDPHDGSASEDVERGGEKDLARGSHEAIESVSESRKGSQPDN